MAMRWGKVADGWGALLDAAARFASIYDEWNERATDAAPYC